MKKFCRSAFVNKELSTAGTTSISCVQQTEKEKCVAQTITSGMQSLAFIVKKYCVPTSLL